MGRRKGGQTKKISRPMKTEAEKVADVARVAGVPDAQISRGDHVVTTVVDLSGELSGKRMSMVKVLLNRGGTAVDRWIARDEKGLFLEPQQNAIRYCRTLWARADGNLTATDPSLDRVDAPLGWSQHEAMTELAKLKGLMPRLYWEVYENVCRFDEEAGTAGSSIATNSRSAIDAAKTTVAFAASLIAMWRRL